MESFDPFIRLTRSCGIIIKFRSQKYPIWMVKVWLNHFIIMYQSVSVLTAQSVLAIQNFAIGTLC